MRYGPDNPEITHAELHATTLREWLAEVRPSAKGSI
jgi:hypothetical protein